MTDSVLPATVSVAEAMRLAYTAATNSPDPSTQNGAVLARRTEDGLELVTETFTFNEFPRGVAYTDERWERPLKYQVIEHAERNAVFAAARSGIATDGLVMVCPWAACADCARAIIQAGIAELITHKQAHDRSPAFWLESIVVANTMLEEGGVTITLFDGQVEGPQVRHTGEIWTP